MDEQDIARRLARLSGAARRLLEYLALLEPARYAVLRHVTRVTEEDLVVDLKEAVDEGLITTLPGEPNSYVFANDAVRERVRAAIGEARLPKLRARAEAARRRVEGP